MSRKTIYTTITPLPAGVTRETVLETLHDHLEMVDLNPAHTERHPISPPPEASAEEYHCAWYSIMDKISYFPGYSGKVYFKACFHDLANGVQTHVYAPMGLDIKEKWTLGGNAPGEPVQPAEIGIGAPISGLYLREDVEMKCNFLMTRFVKKQLTDACATLVARLLVKTQLQEAQQANQKLDYAYPGQSPMSPGFSPPSSGGLDMTFPKYNYQANRASTMTTASEMDSQKSPGMYAGSPNQQYPGSPHSAYQQASPHNSYQQVLAQGSPHPGQGSPQASYLVPPPPQYPPAPQGPAELPS